MSKDALLNDEDDALVSVVIGNDMGEEVPFYILEKTSKDDVDYYLAIDKQDLDEAEEMLILADKSQNKDELLLEIVDDEALLDELMSIFEELLEDTTLSN